MERIYDESVLWCLNGVEHCRCFFQGQVACHSSSYDGSLSYTRCFVVMLYSMVHLHTAASNFRSPPLPLLLRVRLAAAAQRLSKDCPSTPFKKRGLAGYSHYHSSRNLSAIENEKRTTTSTERSNPPPTNTETQHQRLCNERRAAAPNKHKK